MLMLLCRSPVCTLVSCTCCAWYKKNSWLYYEIHIGWKQKIYITYATIAVFSAFYLYNAAMKQLYRSFKLQEYICNRCKSDATAANEKLTVLNQQVAVIEHLCGFYIDGFWAKAQVSPGWHPQKGKTGKRIMDESLHSSCNIPPCLVRCSGGSEVLWLVAICE